MSKKDSQFQKRVMSLMFRGKEIFKPLNTGWIDEHDPKAPWDGYVETDDTEEKARTVRLAKQDESIWRSASGRRVQ